MNSGGADNLSLSVHSNSGINLTAITTGATTTTTAATIATTPAAAAAGATTTLSSHQASHKNNSISSPVITNGNCFNLSTTSTTSSSDISEIPITCEKCSNEFTCQTDYSHHLRDSHGCVTFISTTSLIDCTMCSETFEDMKSYQLHLRTIHDSLIEEDSTNFSNLTGKEDMSPSNSVNGYNSADSFGDPKKKKGPAPRQSEELCLVCGDRASGYHYNALTCEGCKGFFRRSITKNAVYSCKYGNNCDIDMYMRRKCQECRLKKCLNVGMRPECVVPEYQCAIKRESKRAQKEKDKPNSTTKDASPDKEDKSLVIGSNNNNNNNNNNNKNGPTTPLTNGIKPLSLQQEEIIKQLVYFQDLHESPSEADVKRVTPFPLGESDEDNMKRFQHIAEMTILTVQLIVEFSKRVPGFDTLLREDQITLLKSCSSEVMMLRCSRKYDIRTDSIVYANNQPYTRENYQSASVGQSVDAIFGFCRNMCLLKVDNAEYALLTAIVIFSERPQLMEPKKVEKIQEFYIDTLKCYIENHRQPGKCYFAKLLAILTELRTLGNINSEMCFSLKVQNKKLPPFLAEIWDIQE